MDELLGIRRTGGVWVVWLVIRNVIKLMKGKACRAMYCLYELSFSYFRVFSSLRRV